MSAFLPLWKWALGDWGPTSLYALTIMFVQLVSMLKCKHRQPIGTQFYHNMALRYKKRHSCTGPFRPYTAEFHILTTWFSPLSSFPLKQVYWGRRLTMHAHCLMCQTIGKVASMAFIPAQILSRGQHNYFTSTLSLLIQSMCWIVVRPPSVQTHLDTVNGHWSGKNSKGLPILGSQRTLYYIVSADLTHPWLHYTHAQILRTPLHQRENRWWLPKPLPSGLLSSNWRWGQIKPPIWVEQLRKWGRRHRMGRRS